ncbi:hypothetical protein [Candidatus Pelagibacter sp.]|uniref:hypothetical protein n=1 Tax=Candidatus Pelagibacter sp. TaxID=2024849 RepID=UPI003F86C297|tara:strand:+ start:18 stop:929 length:912 start_codon:yes stop_codon:yes gene_type:complete
MKKLILFISWATLVLIIQAKADIIKANCLIDEFYLQEQKIDKSEQEVLAGKVIKLEVDTNKKLVLDKSDLKRIIILTGIPEEGIKYDGDTTRITYQNELKVIDQENDRELKYIYNNSILLENNEISRLNIKIDQTGISLNKWKFFIKCRSGEYTDIEKQIARRTLSPDKSLVKPKYKLDENGKPILFLFEAPSQTRQSIIPQNFIFNADISTLTIEDALYELELKSAEDLLNYYKAKLFHNNKIASLELARQFMTFKKGERISYDDIKNLDEKKFFRIPLKNDPEKYKIKFYKKEYFKEKKKL